MMTMVMVLVVLAGLACLALTEPIIKGRSTIRWGTKSSGTLTGGLSAAVITKVSHQPRGGEPTVIEDGDGFTVAVVILLDGDTLTVTVVDDTGITWPTRGSVVSMKVPGESAAKNFLVVDNNADLERKKEGTRVIKAEYYANITL